MLNYVNYIHNHKHISTHVRPNLHSPSKLFMLRRIALYRPLVEKTPSYILCNCTLTCMQKYAQKKQILRHTMTIRENVNSLENFTYRRLFFLKNQQEVKRKVVFGV